jgi:hypothetical protein
VPSGCIINRVEEAKKEILVEMLGGPLENVYPTALFIFSTSMYVS